MVAGSMLRPAAALALVLASLAAPPAQAGQTRCWVDNGAVVAPAAFGDIAGDFIFDLSAARSVLHLDVAQMNDIEGPAARGTLRLAGARIPATLEVASIDARTPGFPSTLIGIIGADVLAGYVVDLRFSPCRLALWRRHAPRFRRTANLRLTMVGGVPATEASVSDGHAIVSGLFAIDTGARGVRLSADAARLGRTPAGVDAGSRSRPPARLAALSLADELFADTPAGIDPDAPAGLLGGVGTAVWSHWDLRVDLRRRRLQLAPSSHPRP
jgi:hypothetical protein